MTPAYIDRIVRELPLVRLHAVPVSEAANQEHGRESEAGSKGRVTAMR
jgi:hypothetical protein